MLIGRLLRSVLGRAPAASTQALKAEGAAARARGDLDRALECFLLAAHRDPADAEAWNAAGMAHLACGEPAEAIEALESAVRAAAPGSAQGAAVNGNLLLAQLFDPARDSDALRAAHERWAAAHADPLTPQAPPRPAAREGRLRIGYLSPDFRKHVVAWFIEPVLRAHDRGALEVHGFHCGTREDATTARLRPLFDRWHALGGLDDARAAAMVRDAGIDVLVDLAGHTADGRPLVLARRPATLQVSWLGYIGTTGLRAMDYRITDAAQDPPGVAEAWYSERLLRLEGSSYLYAPAAALPPVAPLPADAAGHVTFGALNRIEKASDAALDAWARILRAVPGARLTLAGASSLRARARIGARLGAAGVDAARVAFLPGLTYEAFSAVYAGIDIMLDTFPVNGASTLCESLWMGLPTPSLAVARIGGRLGASVLGAAGCADWVAQDVEGYVALAVRLAEDRAALRETRAGLRARLAASRLLDAPRFTRGLEAALIGAHRALA